MEREGGKEVSDKDGGGGEQRIERYGAEEREEKGDNRIEERREQHRSGTPSAGVVFAKTFSLWELQQHAAWHLHGLLTDYK